MMLVWVEYGGLGALRRTNGEGVKEPSTSINQDRRELVERLNATARNSSGVKSKHGFMEPRGRHAVRRARPRLYPARTMAAIGLMLGTFCTPGMATAIESSNVSQHEPTEDHNTTVDDNGGNTTVDNNDGTHDGGGGVANDDSGETSGDDVPVAIDDAGSGDKHPDDGSDVHVNESPSSEPASSEPTEENTQGTWGTCTWNITNGVLTITAGTGMNSGADGVNIPWAKYSASVKSIRIDGKVVFPADSSHLFRGMALTDVTSLASVDTSNVTNAYGMFLNCSQLAGLTGLDDWNMGNVNSMAYMFASCDSLVNIDPLSKWRPTKVQTTQAMFQDNTKLMDISGTSQWGMGGSLRQAPWMFLGCSSLNDITPLASWRLKAIKDTRGMFAKCGKLTSTSPLSTWDTRNLTLLRWMFMSCGSLTDLSGVSEWDVSHVTAYDSLFQDCSSLMDIGPLEHWDTSAVDHMNRVFQGCSKLIDLSPLSGWHVDNVTEMSYMFANCSDVRTLSPLSEWNTGKTQKINGMFIGCVSLRNLDGLQKWDTGSVEYMGDVVSSPGGTFAGCIQLTDISAIANWNVGKVKVMRDLFYNCKRLEDIGPLASWHPTTALEQIDGLLLNTRITNANAIADWDVSNVWTFWGTFYSCTNLKDISGLSKWKTTRLSQMNIMFFQCNSLEDVSALANWDTGNLKMMDNAFTNCGKLKDTSALANWNLKSIDQSKSPDVFKGCNSLELVGVPTVEDNGSWLLSEYAKVTGSKGWTAFDWAPVNRNLTVSKVQAGYNDSNQTIIDVRVWRLGVKYWGTCPWWLDDDGTLHINDVPGEGTGADTYSEQSVPWYAVRDRITRVATQSKVIMPEKVEYLLHQTTALMDVSGLSKWDSSNTKDIAYFFYGAKKLTDINAISDWDVSKIQNIGGAFSWMDALPSLEALANWNTSSLVNAHHAFQGCQSITSLEPLSNWDVSNVTNMRCLFEGCTGLKNLHGLEDWDVRKVTDMGAFLSMYAWGSNGPTIYPRPTNLENIDAISNWDTKSLTIASSFLAGCSKLKTIDALENFNVSNVSDFGNMFYNCKGLKDSSAISKWNAPKASRSGGMFLGDDSLIRIGVPAVGKGAERISKAYPNRNWTDEGLPITPLKNSDGIYPYMTSNTEGREFTANGGVFIQYQPVYFVNYDLNGANPDDKAPVPTRQWAYVNAGTVTLPDYDGIKTGYDFKGWSDGNGKVLKPGESYRPSSPTDQGTTTLTAVWESVHHHEVPETGSHGVLWLFSIIIAFIASAIGINRSHGEVD